MRFIALGVAAMLLTSPVALARGHGRSRGGSHAVRTHIRKNGSLVRGHRATNSNSSKHDNWSTKGNVNPFTGKAGTKKYELGR